MLGVLATSKWNNTTAAHLLNRAGFGGAPSEIERIEKLILSDLQPGSHRILFRKDCFSRHERQVAIVVAETNAQKALVRHPRQPFPRHPRRGPHGDPALPAPRRTRSVVVRAKRADHA
jgi:hypothetical protein